MIAAYILYSQLNNVNSEPMQAPYPTNSHCCGGYLYSIAENSNHLRLSHLNPDALTPEPIYQTSRLHTHPPSEHIEPTAHLLALLQPPRQELLRLHKPFRLVLRHEQLCTRVDSGKCGTIGIPSRGHGGAAGEEEQLVGQKGEFAERGRKVAGG